MINLSKKIRRIQSVVGEKGFTLIEVIAVIILIGIIAAVIFSRVTTVADTNKYTEANAIRNHIRYAQSLAMKQAGVKGIKCDGAYYWFFETNQPDNASNQKLIAGESNVKISLSDKKISMSSFTVFFNYLGKPYIAYTDEDRNTPVSSANPLNVSINSIPASGVVQITITPETGFIP